MSAETSRWLNTMTLIGNTEKRGNAWHYRESEQGVEPNHYPQAIPVPDVHRRLFHWEPVEAKISTTVYSAPGAPVRVYIADDRKAIIRPAGTFGADDRGQILGVFKDGYRVHGYGQWLVKNVEAILDDGLAVTSAGLLKGGALAWVQVDMPETLETAGFTYRPFLTAATSLDGSLSSTYLTGVQAVVCDNTLSAALGSASAPVKIKHSAQSLGRIGEVRDALGIVHRVAEDFEAQVKALTSREVTDRQWARFLDQDEVAPLTDAKGQPLSPRAVTLMEKKRAQLQTLWLHDARVSPWKGTAFGVMQAVNTWEHHLKGTRGAAGAAERNMLRAVTGGVDKMDRGTLAVLDRVLTAR